MLIYVPVSMYTTKFKDEIFFAIVFLKRKYIKQRKCYEHTNII